MNNKQTNNNITPIASDIAATILAVTKGETETAQLITKQIALDGDPVENLAEALMLALNFAATALQYESLAAHERGDEQMPGVDYLAALAGHAHRENK